MMRLWRPEKKRFNAGNLMKTKSAPAQGALFVFYVRFCKMNPVLQQTKIGGHPAANSIHWSW